MKLVFVANMVSNMMANIVFNLLIWANYSISDPLFMHPNAQPWVHLVSVFVWFVISLVLIIKHINSQHKELLEKEKSYIEKINDRDKKFDEITDAMLVTLRDNLKLINSIQNGK